MPLAVRSGQPRPPGRGGTLALALACGAAAAGLAYVLVGRQVPTAARAEPPGVWVVAAARDLPARVVLTGADLRRRRVPAGAAPQDALRAPADGVGKVTTAALTGGQTVTESCLTARSAALGLAFALPPSQRAVTVALDPANSMAGLLRPGDHVDVLATFDRDGQAVTRTVLQDAPLLALGAQTAGSPDSDKPPASATLRASPQDAQALALASARGRLQLILRPPDDAGTAALPALHSPAVAAPADRPVTRRAAQAPPPTRSAPRPAAPPSVAPAPPDPVVTVVRGAERQSVTVRP